MVYLSKFIERTRKMIIQYIREHDDSYTIEIPEIGEIQCECEKIVPKDDSFECEVCRNLYCPACGTEDYKSTGWFVCNNCQLEPELIIEALIEELQGSK
jgi:hypothetical protein